jgi:hypothetical protein
MATPFTGVIILLMAALAFTACPTEGSGSNSNAVTERNILGITVPEFGGTPVTTITPSSQFTGTVTWEPNSPTFQARTKYIATIDLKPVGSFTFQGVPANYFDVRGAASVSNNANSGRVTVVFTNTGGEDNNPEAVTNVAIDINRPKTGVLAAKFIDDVQYSGTVQWSPGVGETFDVGQTYTATVYLTAKRGWTFAPVQTSWSIAGVDATFANIGGGNATVIATFPVTTNEDTPIGRQGIRLSALPSTGLLASTVTVMDTDEYTGTIEFRSGVGTAANGPDFNGRFLPGSSIDENDYNNGPYAIISLSPKPGFTLIGVPKNYFYIVGLDYEPDKDGDGNQINPANTADRGVITYTFKKLERLVTKSAISDFKVPIYNLTAIAGPPAMPEGGEIASVEVNNNGQYQGTIEWDPLPDTLSWRFKSGVQYTANITLQARKGWTFYSRGEDFFTLPGSVSITHVKSTGKVTAVFPTTASQDNKTTIDGLNIILDGYNSTSGAVTVRQSSHSFDSFPVGDPDYMSVIAEQFERDANVNIIYEPNPGGNFVAGTSYIVTFAIKARPGFTLEGVKADTFKVNGKDAKHAANSGIITVNLGMVPKPDIGTVAEANRAIIGVPLPTTNSQPGTVNITNNTWIKGAGPIEWVPELTSEKYPKKFEPNTTYTAKIKLEDPPTFTYDNLDDVEFFIPAAAHAAADPSLIKLNASTFHYYGTDIVVPGANTPNPTYDPETKTVSVTFVPTAALSIGPGDGSNALPLKAPVTDNVPQKNIEKEGVFTGTVVWYDADDIYKEEVGKFLPEKTYYAVVDLEPVANSYYKFATTDTFTATGASTVDTLTDTALTTGRHKIQVTYPATKKSLPTDIKLDTLPVTGIEPSLGVEFFDPANFPGLLFGTVVWTTTSKPSGVLTNRFGSGLVYTAKFRLYLDTANYSLRGLDPNNTSGYFKIYDLPGGVKTEVEGVDVTYEIKDPDADYLDLTAVFPPTKIAIATLPSAELKIAKTIPKTKDGESFNPDRAKSLISGDVIDSQYYTGNIEWRLADDSAVTPDTEFEDDYEYVARIKLTAKEPYTFARVQATDSAVPETPYFNVGDGKFVTGVAAYGKIGNYSAIKNSGSINTGSSQTVWADDPSHTEDAVLVTIKYAKTQKTIDYSGKAIMLTKLDLSGDKKPETMGALNTIAATEYEITKMVPSTGALASDGTFKVDWTFTYTYTIKELNNFTFKGITNWKDDLFGGQPQIVVEQNSVTSTSGVITKTFLVGYTTKVQTSNIVSMVPIAGLAAPNPVDTPVAAITTSASNYSGAVAWFTDAGCTTSTGGTIAVGTGYYAEITLTPLGGKTFVGFTGTFTVTGFTVASQGPAPTASDPDVYVVVVGPIPGVAKAISGGAITLAAPTLGQDLSTAGAAFVGIPEAFYSATITWAPADASATPATTDYTATIALTITNPNYTFTGVAANAFTCSTATSITFSGSTITIDFDHP